MKPIFFFSILQMQATSKQQSESDQNELQFTINPKVLSAALQLQNRRKMKRTLTRGLLMGAFFGVAFTDAGIVPTAAVITSAQETPTTIVASLATLPTTLTAPVVFEPLSSNAKPASNSTASTSAPISKPLEPSVISAQVFAKSDVKKQSGEKSPEEVKQGKEGFNNFENRREFKDDGHSEIKPIHSESPKSSEVFVKANFIVPDLKKNESEKPQADNNLKAQKLPETASKDHILHVENKTAGFTNLNHTAKNTTLLKNSTQNHPNGTKIAHEKQGHIEERRNQGFKDRDHEEEGQNRDGDRRGRGEEVEHENRWSEHQKNSKHEREDFRRQNDHEGNRLEEGHQRRRNNEDSREVEYSRRGREEEEDHQTRRQQRPSHQRRDEESESEDSNGEKTIKVIVEVKESDIHRRNQGRNHRHQRFDEDEERPARRQNKEHWGKDNERFEHREINQEDQHERDHKGAENRGELGNRRHGQERENRRIDEVEGRNNHRQGGEKDHGLPEKNEKGRFHEAQGKIEGSQGQKGEKESKPQGNFAESAQSNLRKNKD